jgi:hypothetical protein
MILPAKILIAYHIISFNSYCEPYNNFIPYQSYTTTAMIQNHDIKVYERFWNNIIKENIEANDQ